ncbi:MAG: hypothetical protein COB09_17015 [Thalassobium sp.]|nr:MAG: hypothetical protein COB09_17015 [Thalassobium sp.]
MNYCRECKHYEIYIIAPLPPLCNSPAFEDKRDIVSGQSPNCRDVKAPICKHFEEREPEVKEKTFWEKLFG